MSSERIYRCDICGGEEPVPVLNPEAPVCCEIPMRPYEPLFTMENPERFADIGQEFVCGVCGKRVTAADNPPEKPICCGQAMERP